MTRTTAPRPLLPRLAGMTALALAAAYGPSAPARPDVVHPAVIAGVWTESPVGEPPKAVVALALRPEVAARTAHVTFSSPDEEEGPGGYGVFRAHDDAAVPLAPGEVVLLRRGPPAPDGAMVLVTERPLEAPLDVHDLIDEGTPPGTILFEAVGYHPLVTFEKHVIEIGEKVRATVAVTESNGFFTDRTFELVRVAKHFALDGDDPDGPSGSLTSRILGPTEGDADLRVLEGEAGEKRIRSHFDKPTCPWAERHVRWMPDVWLVEYLRPAPVEFELDSSTVRLPGRLSDLWRGYGAVTAESIYPNGFGGTSANYGLPSLLVLPKGTRRRTIDLGEKGR